MNMLRSTLFILNLLVATFASAQGFYKTYTPVTSSAQDVVQTDDGGYFMAGYVSNDSLLFLQRVDAAGLPVWSNNIDLNHARAVAIAKAADGGFVILMEYYADTDGYKNAVLKISATGTVVWTTVLENNLLPNGMRDIVASADGGFVLAGDGRDANLNFLNKLVKLAADGSISWEKTYGSSFHNTSRIVALASGDYAISGGRNGGDLSLARVNASGDLIWMQTYVKDYHQKAYDLLVTTDGQLAMLASSQALSSAPFGHINLNISILKSDLNGNESWFSEFPADDTLPSLITFTLSCFAQDNAGNFYVPIATLGYDNHVILAKTNSTGTLQWKLETPTPGYPSQIIRTADNYLAIAGDSGSKAFLIKSTLEGEYLNSKIIGRVYHDANADCTLNPGETGLNYFTVVATDESDNKYYKKTEADGSYEMRVGEGDFTITALTGMGLPNFSEVCSVTPFTISGSNQTVDNVMIGVKSLPECPMLDVKIGGGLHRRCQNVGYTVTVCNYGNQTSEDSYVKISTNDMLQYVNSTIALTSQNADNYTFEIADLAPGQCQSFNITFFLDCDASLGDVICVDAHAYPDSSCVSPGPNWDGSELEVTGKCETDHITFKIENKGLQPMTHALDYVIIEDHIMFMQGSIHLQAGEDTVFVLPSPGGACYFGKVFGVNNNPSSLARPAAIVENCITGGNLNLALLFKTEGNNAAITNTCNEIVGSFDPNDKTGFPLGWHDEHLIESNQDIEYLIRFQNTGNDTAFLVVIRDTLPVATLNPGTIRPIIASHNYTWDVSGNGIVTFTFPNILLPDSTTNEAESHGFVRFRIRQQPDLADGTRIENSAAIFFDFNDPVITNEYFHTIGRPFIVVSTHNPDQTQLLDVQVLPNPFSTEATFVLKDYSPRNEVAFKLIDALGNVVRKESFSGNTFLFNARNLKAGIYFYRMEENGKLLSSGKVAVSR